jgi:hypothetical protein
MAPKIAVCIPCHAPHIVFLHDCIKSIEEQTRKPDMICISVSATSPAMIPKIDSTIPIFWHTTFKTLCAGGNRNVASHIAVSNGADLLSYFDADDLMLPYRIETLENAFLKYPVDLVLHNPLILKRGSSYEWAKPTGIVKTEPFKIHRDSVCGRVHYMGNPSRLYQLGHCGHITIRKDIWKQHRHVEKYGMGEDSEYIWRCVTGGARPGFLEDILSVYYN